MKLRLLVFAGILLNPANSYTKVAPKETYTVIKPASTQELAPVVEWVKKNKKNLESKVYINSEYFELLTGYIVDINNDGKKEFVFLDHLGSMGCLALYVFTNNNGKISYDDTNPFSTEDVNDEFSNPITKETELFVSAEGKTYICFSGYNELSRTIYKWEKGEVSLCCNNFWITQQRMLFNTLYKQERYHDAYKFLRRFEQSCRHYMDPQTDLWLRNDVALAALRTGCPYTSLKFIKSLMEDTAFAHASVALKNAVNTNKTLCLDAIEEDKRHGSKGKYDYQWLLEYRNQSNNNLIIDQRLDSLLNAVVPDIDIDQYNYPESPEGILWRDDIERHLWGPDQDVKVISDRYVTFSGFYPHSACCRGFFWCDVKEKVSAVVTVVKDLNKPMYITSRSLFLENLPQEFLIALTEWLKVSEIIPPYALFYDRLGISCRIATT